MKVIALFFITICFTGLLHAQIQTYDISSYVRPDLKRSSLQLSGSTSVSRQETHDRGAQDFLFRGIANLDIGLGTFQNSQNYQSDRLTTGNVYGSYDQSTDLGGTSNTKNVRRNYRASILNEYRKRKYYQKDRFWEYGNDFDVSLIRNATHNKLNNTDNTYNNYNIDVLIPFYKGWGRLEYINDAWHAQTILEFLQKKNFINREISHREVTEFADQISVVKNQRFTEFRLYRIYSYEEIIEYLEEHELVDVSNYAFFAHFHDAWQYESFVNRWHGKRSKVGFEFMASGTKSYEEDISESEWRLSPDIGFGYIHEESKAISSDWQVNHEYSLLVKFGLRNYQSTFNPFQEKEWTRSYLGVFTDAWTVGYYPNRRTNMTIAVNTDLIANIKKPAETDFRLSATGSLDYYISPRLRWRLTGSLVFHGPEIGDTRRYSNGSAMSFRTYYNLF